MVAINTIEAAEKPVIKSDTVSFLEQQLREVGVDNARAFSTQIYTLAGDDFDEEQLKKVAALVHHDITQDSFINTPIETEKEWKFAIKVDFKPGVTDNAARVLYKDLGLVDVKDCAVYTSVVHYVDGGFDSNLVEQLERVASNPQIHNITILNKVDFEVQSGFDHTIAPVELGERPNFFEIDLGSMTLEELLKTGKLGTLNLDLVTPDMSEDKKDKLRGGTLSLKEDYMRAILDYSLSEKNTCIKGRKKGVLTDTELEVLAQMWSEHCRHSLYNAAIPESEEGIFTHYIKNPTLNVLKKKPHLGVSIYHDNSGVFDFNDKWLVFVKNETHNSPSALDPFGGAITGIVGVNRDPAGTGIGGEVIGNFLFYFLGHPEDKRRYFKRRLVKVGDEWETVTDEKEWKSAREKGLDWKVEELLLNPKQIFDGVVRGVEEGANQMGIALNLGMCNNHDNYNGKPIVGVGSWGRAPKEIKGLLTHEKHIDVGDRLYVLGGRAGRDGIHGATFSSEALSTKSPATAVQIGDPYTQRKMFEALLELRDEGYIKFVTDLGAGGICCASLEMAKETGGLELDLDKLLIKYSGMTATELFLNESQERMAIAVDEKNKDAIEAILRKHEVEFSDIGMFTDSGRAVVSARGEEVVNLDMDFIHHGFPKRSLNPAEYRISEDEKQRMEKLLGEKRTEIAYSLDLVDNYDLIEFIDMLKRPNFRGVDRFTDKMDSTVKGLWGQHCVQGRGRISTSTACTLVDEESPEGLIQSYGHTERQSYIDSELMGKNAFLRSIGNNIAMGGRLDHMVATDQALWQSSDDPKYQQMLIEANRGMAKVIEGCEIPVISGKDSMYNQAVIYDEDGNVVRRGVFPTLLMTTFAKIDNAADIVTIDAKEEGDLVYVVGSSTKADMGGSEYMNMYSEMVGEDLYLGKVSDENIEEVFDTFKRVNEAQKKGYLQSSNYVEAGGLMTAIRETAMAGERGIEIDLENVHHEAKINTPEIMYGETEGRFLVTIKAENREEFERLFAGKCSRIGTVKGKDLYVKRDFEEIFNVPVNEMMEMYHRREAA
ncbi:hypothetical protein JW707_02315 [Candidatus Woesearchaeota archaeon]|nr:hypothetical protein [Candidatus Woesearchaeota archaeon]